MKFHFGYYKQGFNYWGISHDQWFIGFTKRAWGNMTIWTSIKKFFTEKYPDSRTDPRDCIAMSVGDPMQQAQITSLMAATKSLERKQEKKH